MKLSNTNAKILLVEANRIIEKYADSDATKIVEKKDFNFMCYPPNCGFSDAEKIELGKLDNNEALKSAWRKLFANNSATVLFHLFNIIDETGDPQGENSAWTGVKMIDLEPNKDLEPAEDFLHDMFFDTYWDWREKRGEKGWKLDTYED